jgi:hypothetical protein
MNDGDGGQCLVFNLESVELYRDVQTGEITTTPVVFLIDGPAPRPVARPP